MSAILLIFAAVLFSALLDCVLAAGMRRFTSRAHLVLLLIVASLYALILLVRPANPLFIDAVVIAGAAVGGAYLGRGIADRGSLVGFSIAAAIADVVSYLLGPTHLLLEKNPLGPSLVNYLAVSMPVNGRLVPLVGIGDLIILAGLCVSLQNLRYSYSSFAAPVLGLLVALGVGLLIGGVFGIPFMAAAVLAVLFARTGP